MKIIDSVSKGTSIVSFFTKNIESVHAKNAGDYAALSDIPLLICVKFEDADEVYSVLISESEVVIEEEEMIDFPHLTIKTSAAEWPLFLSYVREYAIAFERKKSEIAKVFRISEALEKDVEGLDLVIELEVYDAKKRVMKSEIILNDYEPSPSAKKVKIKVQKATLDGLADGTLKPVEAAKDLSISGALFKAAELGQLFLKHRLE